MLPVPYADPNDRFVPVAGPHGRSAVADRRISTGSSGREATRPRRAERAKRFCEQAVQSFTTACEMFRRSIMRAATCLAFLVIASVHLMAQAPPKPATPQPQKQATGPLKFENFTATT